MTHNSLNGLESKLWDAAEYKHVVLGLIFLKYISDAEDPDEYLAENVFFLPKEARWALLQANAKIPTLACRSTT
jgi:type I restriction enzyme M protein